MRAVVYQHESDKDLGLLEPALVAAGFELVRRFRAVHHREDLDAALVVVLGGTMSVRAQDVHPFLRDEAAVLAERLAVDAPCLGLCLGAQLIASASGAQVSVGKNGFEVGVHPVRWTKAGLDDPAIEGTAPKGVFAHWHEDTFSAPAGATLLASTDRYTQQAFRLGRSYGFQFHPELTAKRLGEWVDSSVEELELYGCDLAALRAQLPKLAGAEAANAAFLERVAFQLAKSLRPSAR